MNPTNTPASSAPLEPGPPPDPHDPYAFIMNSGTPPPKNKLPLPRGNSKLQRVALVAIGGVLLLTIGLVGLSIFSGGGSAEKLLSIAQDQTEIVRIADLGLQERTMRSSVTKNFAANTSLSVSTSLQQVSGLIPGKKPNDKTLSLKKSTKVDSQLTAAAANNQYDQTFTEILTQKLQAYQSELKVQYNDTTNNKEKAVLKKAYDGTVILLGQNK